MELEQQIFGDDAQDDLPEELKQMSADDIARRSRLLDNEIRVLKDESQRLQLDQQTMKEKVSPAWRLLAPVSPSIAISNMKLMPRNCALH